MAEEVAAQQPAAPDPKLPFAEQMRAIDPKVFDPDTPPFPSPAPTEAEPEAAAEAEETEKPKTGKAAKQKTVEVPADATAAEIEQLKQLASKHGYEFDDSRLTTADKAKFRRHTDLREKQIQQLEREVQERVEKATKEFEDRFKYADEVSEFKTTRDFQKLAKSLGYENWDKLQEDVIAQNTDPNYRRLRELEQFRDEQLKREQEQRQQFERQQQENARIEAQRQYMTKLSGEMTKSKDPLCAIMADDPSFINAIFQIQRENYNQADDSTVTPEQAASMAVRGAAKPVRTELKALYDRLHKVFGAEQPKPEPPAGTVAKPKPKTDAVPAPRASKVTKHDPGTRDWLKMAEEQMRQAADEERRQRIAAGYKS